ncbi:MAG TPA: alanine--tRNA ligase [Alphaproteobacteria bacterium]|nr:alanine--tRNA ligase [Alphaproteobacteria bacterium]
MTSVNQIRKTFLDYFAKNGHKVVPSSSLVPDNDPTLMFTNSGMVQFKNVLAGNETRDYTRATTAQKSVRAGGKHNDLDSVGYDVRHHTFFEMLGNFSFGDYFKDGAIPFAWELLTKDFGLPKDKLAVTIYYNDEEAYNLWKKVSGLPDDRIIRISTKDNFWQMGDTGPCGPCSEIFYDHGPEVWGGLPGTPEEDGDRFIEIWNLVFDQFEDLADGSRINLKRPGIDTGMGLERIAAILQGVHSNFDTDMFQHIIKAIADMANTDPNGPLKASHNVIADHLRSICFLIADGVLPSNEGRGYVLRRIMRRAMRHAYMLGIKDPMIYKLLPTLQKEMGDAYPELYTRENLISETIKIEEERFGRTLDKGLKLLDEEISHLGRGDKLSGETAFKLYDTYGFPLDLTQDALKNKNIEVDTEGFDACMAHQKEEARKNWAGSGDTAVEKVWYSVEDKVNPTEFLGYNVTKSDGEIVALVQDNKEVNEVTSGKFELVANQTPFYGECGGQVGDTGLIVSKDFTAKVTDTKRKLEKIFVHVCELEKGSVKVGDCANFEVDEENRKRICANHSVTHLAHKALKMVLGDHVAQKGSMVEADRMRFDVSHPKQITAEQLRQVEDIVNEQIRNDLPVTTVIMNKEEAVKLGAMALFDEKYGDDVRVVTIGGENAPFSRELCGGTHVCSTGNIGYFHIIGESAVAAGVRRLECLTGVGADSYVRETENKLHHVAAALKTNLNDLETRINSLLEERKKQEQEIFNLKKSLASGKSSTDETETVNGVKFVGKLVSGAHPKELKAFVDDIMQNLGSGIVVLCSDKDDKASVVVGVSKDLTAKYNAVDLVRAASAVVGGQGGGGRPDMAQAGGSDVSKINDAIAKIKAMIA